MYCRNCGSEIHPDSKFCQNCGFCLAPPPPSASQTSSYSQQSSAPHYQSPQQERDSFSSNVPKTKQRSTSSKGATFVIIIIVLSCLYLWYSTEKNSSIQYSATTSTMTATKTLTAHPFFNGKMVKMPGYEQVCPLSVSVRGDDAYYIYLKYQKAPSSTTESRTRKTNSNNEPDVAFLIKPNSTVSIDVPIGVYKLYYCCGETWYGQSDKFGPQTSYSASNDLLTFYADSQYYRGHTLELWAQVNGNFDDYPINANQFPG